MYLGIQAILLEYIFVKFSGGLRVDFKPLGATVGGQQSGRYNQRD